MKSICDSGWKKKIIEGCFNEVSTLIRNSDPYKDADGNKISVSDFIRLKLYGYYKCATAITTAKDSPRPSFFDPVGRAKYEAWIKCEEECNNNHCIAMEKYLELAASQDQTEVGKKCAEIYRGALFKVEQIFHECEHEATVLSDKKRESLINTEDSKVIGVEVKSTKENGILLVTKPTSCLSFSISSILPTPLIPRGQLDISFADFMFVLLQCIQHTLHETFLGGGFIHRCLLHILPSFLIAVINITFASFHPRFLEEKYERKIVHSWLKMSNNQFMEAEETNHPCAINEYSDSKSTQVIVGLSVRTLFDLYLSIKSYPTGSEVLIVPGVTIQGMIDIMEYHHLKLVPIDLPKVSNIYYNSSNQENDESQNEPGNSVATSSKALNDLEVCASTRWGIDLDAVKKAISKKTVAIFVVHPFGTVLAGPNSMMKLRDIAVEYDLDLWEDCAQCYSGNLSWTGSHSKHPNLGYLGSRYADISFFSFGPIKTATALGGGLAILRIPYGGSKKHQNYDVSHLLETSQAMRRIQESIYAQQSNFSYTVRVLKCLIIHGISHSYIACGAVKLIVEKFGYSYDNFVVSSLRGFSGGVTPREKSLEQKDFIMQLRQRPCPALLALLLRRLFHSEATGRGSVDRTARLHSFEQLLITHQTSANVLLPKNIDGSGMNGWLFPIQVKNPPDMSKALLNMGFDVPCGMSQLKPVSVENTRIYKAFKQIIYLPIPTRNFTSNHQYKLLEAIKNISSQEEPIFNNQIYLERRKRQPLSLVSVRIFSTSAIFAWMLSNMLDFRTLFFMRLLHLLYDFVPLICASTIFGITMLHFFIRFMGPIYQYSSRTFSKYCDMIFESPFQDKKGSCNAKITNFQQSRVVLNLDCTKFTHITPLPKNKNDNDLQVALLTGATGFIGSLLLRELLLHRHSLRISGGVAVIVRTKRGKSGKERINELLSLSMFDFLREEEKQSLIYVTEGDVTLPDCGLKRQQRDVLFSLNISHVFHCAAAVSFSQSLEDAAISNISSSLQILSLTKNLRRKEVKFVYISTAFVHGDKTGTSMHPLSERLFPLHPYDPMQLYKSMLGTQSYASAAMKYHGFPNTYTFSKCICEHLLHADQSIDTIIIRPSIVGPSTQEPFEGWAGEKPSTIVAAACLYLKFPYNLWCFGKETVPFVPVDIVCRFVILKSFRLGQNSSADSNELISCVERSVEEKKDISPNKNDLECSRTTVMNVAWDSSSLAQASFSWVDYAFAITHLGSVCGHVNIVVAYAGLLFSTKIFPYLNFRRNTFERLHNLLIRTPIDAVLDLCQKLDIKEGFTSDMKALSPFLELPILFFPFANQNYYFTSALIAPPDFNAERYMFSCAVAAHKFLSAIEKHRTDRSCYNYNLREYSGSDLQNRSRTLVVAGSNHKKPVSDLLWALTQPKGNLFIRLGGWILTKIFRLTSAEIEVDVASFVTLAREIATSSATSQHVTIIAPTHRSFYDFLITSYICFTLPELGLEIPYIAAASDFAQIPIIGWLASGAHAFYLKRGGKNKDPNLKKILDKITRGTAASTFVEVFIEGKRSRYRTFSLPKTGFLRCLAETERKYVVLPVTINYEGLPDEASLIDEANTGSTEIFSLGNLVSWSFRVLLGKVNIGRVYVSASRALDLSREKMTEIKAQVFEIQSCQRSRILVSDFHIEAASLALDLPFEMIREALTGMGVTFWPNLVERGAHVSLPQNSSLLWAAMMHFGHNFAPYLALSHPMWSSWLCPTQAKLSHLDSTNELVNAVLKKLIEHFESAESIVDDTLDILRRKGFHNPSEKHVMQYVPENQRIPPFLIRIAFQFKSQTNIPSNLSQNHLQFNSNFTSASFGEKSLVHPIRPPNNPNSEAFGAWGYQDSYFVMHERSDGSKYVMMKGGRYSICGKRLPELAKFVEDELKITINVSNNTFPTFEGLHHIPDTTLTEKHVSEIAAVLESGMNQLSLKPDDRARHGTGHTHEDVYYLRTGILNIRVPDVVVWPRSNHEIQFLVSLALKHDWCVIPFGGGTNVTHATHCPSKSDDPRPMLSVDMKLMDRVIWVNEEDGLAHVEAGITGGHLMKYMEKIGFTIGHEPDSYEFSTLGGWIATKSSGMKQNKYGNIEDIVKEVKVIGANGFMSDEHKLDKVSFGRVSTGIDLKSLMLGSEGCFGIIVSAVIKIWPLAHSTSYESVLLPNFNAGIRFAREVSKMGVLKPASVRVLDNNQFRLGQSLKEEQSNYAIVRNYVSKLIAYYFGHFSEKSVVCATMTFEGSPGEVKLQKKIVRALATMSGGILAGPNLGKAGYNLTFAIAYLRDFALNYNILGESFETFVPWSKLKQVIEVTKKRIYLEHKNHALPGSPFVSCRVTQLYDEGVCVYFYFSMNIEGVPDASATFTSIEACARQEILDAGGSLSHHHGLGKLRSRFVNQIYSNGYINSIKAIKNALDPSNVFGARNGVFSIK